MYNMLVSWFQNLNLRICCLGKKVLLLFWQKMSTCGLPPGEYGFRDQDLLKGLKPNTWYCHYDFSIVFSDCLWDLVSSCLILFFLLIHTTSHLCLPGSGIKGVKRIKGHHCLASMANWRLSFALWSSGKLCLINHK